MSKRKDTKLLIDFFSRDLSEKQKKEFLDKATNDPEFLNSFIDGVELDEAYDDLFEEKDKDEPFKPVFRQKRFKLLTYIVSAAAVIVFGLIFGIEQYQRSQPSGDILFSDYYEPFDLGLTRSGKGKSTVGYLYYNYITEDYEAINQTKIEDLDSENSQAMIYLIYSVAALENEDFIKATELLNKISPEDDYYSIACWYRALLHIRDEQYQDAVLLLVTVTENALMFRAESFELIDYMKKKGLVN